MPRQAAKEKGEFYPTPNSIAARLACVIGMEGAKPRQGQVIRNGQRYQLRKAIEAGTEPAVIVRAVEKNRRLQAAWEAV